MTDLYTHISTQIRKLRGEQSQETMANRLGIATNTLSRWETGTYKPTAEDLDNIARTYKVPIDTFFLEPDGGVTEQRTKALTSALGGLDEDDFNEVLQYAQFRKARLKLQTANIKPKRKKG